MSMTTATNWYEHPLHELIFRKRKKKTDLLTFGTYYSFALQVTQLCNCKYLNYILPSTSPFVTGKKKQNKTSNLARPGVLDTIHGQRRTRKSPIQSLLHLGQVSSPPKKTPPPPNQSQSHLRIPKPNPNIQFLLRLHRIRLVLHLRNQRPLPRTSRRIIQSSRQSLAQHEIPPRSQFFGSRCFAEIGEKCEYYGSRR